MYFNKKINKILNKLKIGYSILQTCRFRFDNKRKNWIFDFIKLDKLFNF